jgi:hypothetical protein
MDLASIMANFGLEQQPDENGIEPNNPYYRVTQEQADGVASLTATSIDYVVMEAHSHEKFGLHAGVLVAVGAEETGRKENAGQPHVIDWAFSEPVQVGDVYTLTLTKK